MVTDFVQFALPPWQLVVRSVVIYFGLLVGLRLFGKRQIGQFTIFDLVMILLIANAVQPAMTGTDSTLLGGLIIIGTLLLVNWGVSWARERVPIVGSMLEGRATVIARDGRWLKKEMHRQGISHDSRGPAPPYGSIPPPNRRSEYTGALGASSRPTAGRSSEPTSIPGSSTEVSFP